MWQPGWEESLGENGYMHMYTWVPLLSTWNHHSVLISLCCAVLRGSVVSNSLWPPWTVTCQAPLFMGFSRQEYWSGWRFLLQGIVPTQGLTSDLPHCRQSLSCLTHQGKSSTACCTDAGAGTRSLFAASTVRMKTIFSNRQLTIQRM